MKKLFSVIVVFSIVLSTFCSVFAAEDEIIEMPEGGRLLVAEYDETLPNEAPIRTRGPQPTFEEFVEDQLMAHTDVFSVYNYRLTLSEFMDRYYGVVISNYKILASTRFAYNQYNGYVYYVAPCYLFDYEDISMARAEEEAARTEMDRIIQSQYLDPVANIPNSEVVGKMLAIHDIFCSLNEYATEELAEEETGAVDHDEIYTAYWVLSEHRAVCQGNASALKAIYDALNEEIKAERGTTEDVIKTGLCANEDHIWNVVKIDGQWYHIDETYNDPIIRKTTGEIVHSIYARHNCFLRSTNSIWSDHFKSADWTYYADETVVCSDTKYEGSYIFNVFLSVGTLISYVDGRYRLEVDPVSLGSTYPFWSKTVNVTTIIATDPYDSTVGTRKYKAVKFYSRVAAAGYYFRTIYNANGTVNRCFRMTFSKNAGLLTYNFQAESVPQRIFIWESGTAMPLCRMIELPAL